MRSWRSVFGPLLASQIQRKDLVCCGLDLNQHTLSGTSPSNWHQPLLELARACSRTHLFAISISAVRNCVKRTCKDLQRLVRTAKRIMSQIVSQRERCVGSLAFVTLGSDQNGPRNSTRHGGRLASELQSASIAICVAHDTFVTQLIADLLYRRNRKHLGRFRGFSSQNVARFRAYP